MLLWSVELLHKERSIKECYNTPKVFKQRKQLIWNLKFQSFMLTLQLSSAK